jgi:hypothetical protein
MAFLRLLMAACAYGTGPAPVFDRRRKRGPAVLAATEIDGVLARLDADNADISVNLVALEGHPGTKFLSALPLTGTSADQWNLAQAKVALLWSRFAMVQAIAERAHRIRKRSARPGRPELDELTLLLTGPAATLAPEEIPIEHRALLGPAAMTRSMTLAELIAAMTADYRDVARLVAAADAVRSTFTPQLARCDDRVHSAERTAATLDLRTVSHPLVSEIASVASTLDALRAKALSDPLSLVADETVDDQPLIRVAGVLDSIDARLTGLSTQRDAAEQRGARLAATLDQLAEDEEAARRATALASEKIDAPVSTITPAVAGLRDRLGLLRSGGTQRHWTTVADQLSELEAASAAARTTANAAREGAEALLDRRNELRGRIDAYRVKMARLQLSEDPAICDRFERAQQLLATAPCDLAAATAALADFQRTLNNRTAAR